MLRSTWALFQLSWPSGLPLALVGVVASGMPGAEAARSGAPRGIPQDPQWWGLYVASIVLMLICYGALTLRQASLADRAPLPVFDALRRGALALPSAGLTAVIVMAAIVAGLVLAVVPGLALTAWLSMAWVAALTEGSDPAAAIRRSIAMVRGRFWPLAGAYAAVLAAVLVFVMLAGIFVGVLMAIAGQQGPTSVAGQMLSRLLFGCVIALPVVYVGAAQVVVFRTLQARPPT